MGFYVFEIEVGPRTIGSQGQGAGEPREARDREDLRRRRPSTRFPHPPRSPVVGRPRCLIIAAGSVALDAIGASRHLDRGVFTLHYCPVPFTFQEESCFYEFVG